MGYRVGFQCFDSAESAHDYVLSQVQPLLTPEGVLRPEKVGKEWVYQGSTVKLGFPECSAVEQIQAGMLFGSSFFMLFAVMFGFKLLKNMIYSGGFRDDG